MLAFPFLLEDGRIDKAVGDQLLQPAPRVIAGDDPTTSLLVPSGWAHLERQCSRRAVYSSPPYLNESFSLAP